MQESVSVEQLGHQDLVAMSNSLEQRMVHMSPDTLADVPDSHQERIQAWLDGKRLMPRFLTPSLDPDFLINDDEYYDSVVLDEEMQDACALTGVEPIDVVALNDDQAEELLSWIDTIHVQAQLAFRDEREPVYSSFPQNLVIEPEPEPAKNPFELDDGIAEVVVAAMTAEPAVEPEPVEEPTEELTSPNMEVPDDGVIGDSDSTGSFKPETREEAKERLHSEMHFARESLVELTGKHEEAKEAAKHAKKRMELAQDRLNEIVTELDEVLQDGFWQPYLPLGRGDSVSVAPVATKDPALTAKVHDLVEHGVSEKQCDKLVDAQVETIAEVEQRIRDGNPLTKITGIGQSAADRFADALIGWRNQHGYGADDE